VSSAGTLDQPLRGRSSLGRRPSLPFGFAQGPCPLRLLTPCWTTPMPTRRIHQYIIEDSSVPYDNFSIQFFLKGIAKGCERLEATSFCQDGKIVASPRSSSSDGRARMSKASFAIPLINIHSYFFNSNPFIKILSVFPPLSTIKRTFSFIPRARVLSGPITM
jgi:hypothetical protein